MKLVNINFGILGPTALWVNGRIDERWGTPRVRALLATLLVHAGRSVPQDRLMAWMWSDDSRAPDNPVSAFHTYSTRLRYCLKDSFPDASLRSSDGVWRLDIDRSQVDYHHFRTLVQAGRDHLASDEPRRAKDDVERALLLWRGRPLHDLSTEPARAWRTRVENERVAANTVLLHALIQLHEFDSVLSRLDELESEHDVGSSTASVRLDALYGLGRSAEATEYYFTARRRLLRDGDDLAAERLRHHHESLRARAQAMEPAESAPGIRPPRQLRHDVTDFVGRADLLDALDVATTSASGEPTNSVVVVDGMPGVGKTALVVHWGHLNRPRFPDGDLFINLHGYSRAAMLQPSAIVDDLLIGLGAPPDRHITARARELLLARLLADRRTLVVLDNARNSAQVEALVPLLAGSTVVVTSRQRLTNLTAATAVRTVGVRPLNAAESGALFDARVGVRRRISDGERRRLIELCAGLPLMITVLAEHLAAGPDVDIAGREPHLDRRQMITDIGEDGDGPAVPETFLSWSYQAMPTAEQRLFRLLSIHPGPDFSTLAACACDGRTESAIRQSLRRLVAANLLEQSGAFDRFQFHDVLREFASHLTHRVDSPDERRAAERRLLSHYLQTANQAIQTLYPGYMHAPDVEDVETVDAVSFAEASQATDWFDRERSNLTSLIHQGVDHGHDELAWQLVDPVSTWFDRRGYYDDSRSVREVAVMSARAAGHRDAEASTLVGLGMVQAILGDHTGAHDNLMAALRIVESTGNRRGQGSALHQLARLQLQIGNPAEAITLYRRCLQVNQDLGDVEGLSWTHCRLGAALRAIDQHEQALQHLHQGQFHAQRSGDDAALASCQAEIGAVYRDRGDYAAAESYCEQALKTVEGMPVPELVIETQVCLSLAELNFEGHNYDVAINYLDRVDRVTERTHSIADQARTSDLRADIKFACGEPGEANQYWRRAAELYGHAGNLMQTAVIGRKLDRLATGLGSVPEARDDSCSIELPRTTAGRPDNTCE